MLQVMFRLHSYQAVYFIVYQPYYITIIFIYFWARKCTFLESAQSYNFITYKLLQQQSNKIMYSSSKTPPRRAKSGPSIELINGVERFKTTFNPIISKENKQILEAKLAVEKESTAATTDRIFNNNLYVNYQKNPFNHFKQKKHQFSNTSYYSTNTHGLEKPTRGKKLSQIPKEKTIMDQITELQSPNLRPETQKKIRRYERINQILIQSSKTSNKILSQLEKSKRTGQARSLIQIKQPSLNKSTVKLKKQTGSTKNDEKQKMQQMSIDQIVGMQDSNHFMNEGRKKINIFKSLNNDEQILSPYQQLCEHKFSFDSVILKMNKVMIPILRELSKFSRSIMCTPKQNVAKVIDILQNEELSLKEKQIKFVDLMGFASGRLSSELLIQLSNNGISKPNEEDSDTNSVQQEDAFIPYRMDHSHFFSNFKGQSEEKKEIMEFQYIEPSLKERKYREEFSLIKNKVKNLLQSKQFNLSNRIYDKKLHEQTQQRIQQTFHHYLTIEKTKLDDIGKVVRKNKIFKSKDESFRLKTMIEVLKEKNQLDAYLSQNK